MEPFLSDKMKGLKKSASSHQNKGFFGRLTDQKKAQKDTAELLL